jgi:hypothetical protein
VGKIGECGLVFVEQEAGMAVHMDAAELGRGGTLGPDAGQGAEGYMEDSGIWTAREKMESIALRELKAVHLVLGQRIGVDVSRNGVRRVKLFVDNLGAEHIIRKMSLRSRAIMREVRVLQRLLENLGITLDPHWLPSAENFFADRLSRTWDPSDLTTRACIPTGGSLRLRARRVVRERRLGIQAARRAPSSDEEYVN